MEQQLISVVVPSYNRDASVMCRSVKSVLNQTYRNVEVIVVDDNPNDSEYCPSIRAFCAGLERVCYVKQDGNRGACAARNLGIERANGEWIGFLDDDDEWLPEKLEKSVPFFQDGIGIVASPGYVLEEDDAGNIRRTGLYHYNAEHKSRITHYDFLISDPIGSTSQAIVRKQCFADCGGFDVLFPARQDYEMWIRISQKYDVHYVDEPLFNHYMHAGEQISRNPHKSVAGYTLILKKYAQEFRQHPEAGIRQNIRILKAARRGRDYSAMLRAGLRCAGHPICAIRYLLKK